MGAEGVEEWEGCRCEGVGRSGYYFLFLLPFDAEAFRPCKSTIKVINLCALPCLGFGLWLTLTVYFDLA